MLLLLILNGLSLHYFELKESNLIFYALTVFLMFPSINVLLFASFSIFLVGASGLYFPYHISYFMLLPLAFMISLTSGSLIHNAAHFNFKPKWLNKVIGELLTFHHLLGGGFQLWAFQHNIHHRFPDDPEKDTHPPLHQSYWSFVNRLKITIERALRGEFENNFGSSDNTKRLWTLSSLFVPVNRFLRASVLLTVFGAKLYSLFLIPSFISIVLMTAHFNFVTHRPNLDDDFDILNKNENIIFKMINMISFNMYFHKNHHLKPNLINPKVISTKPIIQRHLTELEHNQVPE